MKNRIAAAATASIAAALAAPGLAHGATLAAQGACFVQGAQVPVVGAQWLPGSFVSIAGGAAGSAQADGAGNIATQVVAPPVSTIAPQTVTITANDPTQPTFTATASFPVIRDVLLSNAPINGRPRQKTTWRFVGFPVPGTAIYGHYRFHSRTIKNFRFGRATGPCGTLVVRARRMPIAANRIRSGTWTLQLDQRRHYRRTGLRRVIRFRIFRTLL
jgi:hypothetical protein